MRNNSGFREGAEREGESEKEGQLAMSTPQDPPSPMPTLCDHEWIQDLWMSGLTIHPKVKDDIPQAKTIPLFRCVKCGLLRLPIAEDAAPPA